MHVTPEADVYLDGWSVRVSLVFNLVVVSNVVVNLFTYSPPHPPPVPFPSHPLPWLCPATQPPQIPPRCLFRHNNNPGLSTIFEVMGTHSAILCWHRPKRVMQLSIACQSGPHTSVSTL